MKIFDIFKRSNAGVLSKKSETQEPGTTTNPFFLRSRDGGLALIAIAALGLGACTPGATAQNRQNQGNEQASLSVALDTDPVCVDAHQGTTNASFTVTRATVDSLTDQDPETGELVPWLAKSWDTNEDYTEFTFHLRDDVTFHDGTAFEAQSVKNNFENIIQLGAKASLGSTFLAGLDDITVEDPQTVRVSFEKPNAQFLQATSTASLGFYADSTLSTEPETRCTTGLVGTGPFKVTQFTPGESARLVRNDDYAWPSELAQHVGPAQLAQLELQVVPEASVRMGALSAGDIDVDTQVLPQNEELFEASDFSILTRPNPGMAYSLYPNLRNPTLADERVRQALSKAIDRAELQAVISKYQSPATAVLAKTTPFYQDQSELLEYDPQAAAQLLEEAGWKLNPDTGIREKDGQPLRFDQPYWQTVPFIELVQQQLREVGVDYGIRKTSIGEVQALREDRSYDFEFYNSTRSDPDIMRTHLGLAGANRNNREAADIDELMAELAATMDPQVREELSTEVSAKLIEKGYAIPLVELSAVMAVAPYVTGLSLESNSRLNFYNAGLSEVNP